MAIDYAALRAKVDKLVGPPGGQQGFLRPAGNGAPIPCRFVVVPYGDRERERDGDLIMFDDQRCYLSPVGLPRAPLDTDRLELANGQTRRIVTIVETDPAATGAVVYELQLRK